MDVAHDVAHVRDRVSQWRAAGERIALVPTMGALHAGHMSLVELARSKAERVIVSIFVNPTQFAPQEDFAAYPRTFEDDAAELRRRDVDLIFAPDTGVMYPAGFATTISLAGPAQAGLEDAFRPTHFAGVATVVAKLLIQTTPDFAIFGEKDYQQLKVVTRLARDLDLPVTIVPGPTMREPDGLALSSRNRYLSPAAREKATALPACLRACAERLRAGEPAKRVLEEGRATLTEGGFLVDYLELRDAESLSPIARPGEKPCRLLVAARIERTRLIDNMPV